MEGRILGNRYELLEKIGGGGMALVYRARCTLLNRDVAIKILRPEFTNDEEFVKRFRVEAQAAASLSHPNIVSIYDVGHEDNIHYLVMEYIDGTTLKEYIEEKGVLGWREAVNITIQICSAIEQAHRKNIIHRDIKPHNIMLTSEGIAKVTDFGIARAVSSSTITVVGSTIGSVHYFSPEQARGGYIDEKSDIYSLGIAMYEMVTGEVPFTGESPVTVALKHLQDEPVPPKIKNPDLPQGVNDIIMKAIKKDKSKRYQSASDMLSDLFKVLKEPGAGFLNDTDDTEAFPTKKMQAISDEMLNEKEESQIKEKKNNKRKEKLAVWMAIITSLAIISIFIYVGYRIFYPSFAREPDFIVDNYVGKNIVEVKSELESMDITVEVKRVYDENIPTDVIISQSINDGQKVQRENLDTIVFEVSDGPERIIIPDLKSEDYRTAEAKLKNMKLKVRIEEEHSETIANNLVTRTEPKADEEVKPGTIVIVYKSIGPKITTVVVPSLTGKTRAEAQQLLIENKLSIGRILPEGIVSDVAKIAGQFPEAGTEVNEGTPVDLIFDIHGEDQNNTGSYSSGNDTDNGKNVKRNIVSTPLNLTNPESYEDEVKVYIEITPSDTNKVEVFMDDKVKTSSFPLSLPIPVPEGGYTKVRVILNGKFYTEFVR
ncbi:MAG TPA: Stk1 family PASTA domain-containing Ser/Thr kinase [Clostridiaceae bacterium]|nr:Stk1 family PASTA domain-containing Ser/Thr kinase [Clostridiaceae bacterium]